MAVAPETIQDLDDLSEEDRSGFVGGILTRALDGENVFGEHQSFVLDVATLSMTAAAVHRDVAAYVESQSNEVISEFINLLESISGLLSDTSRQIVVELVRRAPESPYKEALLVAAATNDYEAFEAAWKESH